MKKVAVVLSLGLVALSGCDRGANSGQRAETLIAGGLEAPLFSSGDTEQDSMPIVVRRIWFDASPFSSPSPDGRYLVFGEGGYLTVRDVRTGENRRLTDDESNQIEYISVSPDGNVIAFASRNDDGAIELWTIHMDGSQPRLLFSDESVDREGWLAPHGWSPDGEHILALFAADGPALDIVLISARDGAIRTVKRFDRGGPGRLSFSPDGRYIAYEWRADREAPRDVFAIEVDGGHETPLIQHPADDGLLGWAPDGEHVLFSSDRMGTVGAWLLPVADGEPDGSPILVKPELWRASPAGFTRDGSFFYIVSTSVWDVHIARLDPVTGSLVESPTPATQRSVGGNGGPEWSPDGRYLAWRSQRVSVAPGTAPSDIFMIRSSETGETRELTPDLNQMRRPRWSPDGRSLLVKARGEMDRWGLFKVDVETAAAELLINVDTYEGRWADWSADGRSIYYSVESYEGPGGQAPRIIGRDLETGHEYVLYTAPEPVLMTPGNLALSPDHRKVAVVLWPEDENRGGNLVIVPVDGGEPSVLHRFAAGANKPRNMRWTPDGRYLVYTVWDAREIWRVPAAGGVPELLQWQGMEQQVDISFHPDGERIAFTAGAYAFEVWVMEGFLPSGETGN